MAKSPAKRGITTFGPAEGAIGVCALTFDKRRNGMRAPIVLAIGMSMFAGQTLRRRRRPMPGAS
jgi:hypothetical protein